MFVDPPSLLRYVWSLRFTVTGDGRLEQKSVDLYGSAADRREAKRSINRSFSEEIFRRRLFSGCHLVAPPHLFWSILHICRQLRLVSVRLDTRVSAGLSAVPRVRVNRQIRLAVVAASHVVEVEATC